MTPTEAGMAPMRATLSSFTMPLFRAMRVAYWGLRGDAALASRRRFARQRSGRVLGVALVLVLAWLAIAGAHGLLIVDGARVFELLPADEQARLSGAAIATGLLPALYVLVPVGVDRQPARGAVPRCRPFSRWTRPPRHNHARATP
jgi:hypothetical protein